MNIIKCVLKKEVLFVLLAISMMALLSGCIGLGEDSKGTPAEDIYFFYLLFFLSY